MGSLIQQRENSSTLLLQQVGNLGGNVPSSSEVSKKRPLISKRGKDLINPNRKKKKANGPIKFI